MTLLEGRALGPPVLPSSLTVGKTIGGLGVGKESGCLVIIVT